MAELLWLVEFRDLNCMTESCKLTLLSTDLTAREIQFYNLIENTVHSLQVAGTTTESMHSKAVEISNILMMDDATDVMSQTFMGVTWRTLLSRVVRLTQHRRGRWTTALAALCKAFYLPENRGCLFPIGICFARWLDADLRETHLDDFTRDGRAPCTKFYGETNDCSNGNFSQDDPIENEADQINKFGSNAKRKWKDNYTNCGATMKLKTFRQSMSRTIDSDVAIDIPPTVIINSHLFESADASRFTSFQTWKGNIYDDVVNGSSDHTARPLSPSSSSSIVDPPTQLQSSANRKTAEAPVNVQDTEDFTDLGPSDLKELFMTARPDLLPQILNLLRAIGLKQQDRKKYQLEAQRLVGLATRSNSTAK